MASSPRRLTASKGVGGDRLAKFIAGKAVSPYVSKELANLITDPLKFKTTTGSVAYGYEIAKARG